MGRRGEGKRTKAAAVGDSVLFSHINSASCSRGNWSLISKANRCFHLSSMKQLMCSSGRSDILWTTFSPLYCLDKGQSGGEDGEVGAPLGSQSQATRLLLLPTRLTEPGGHGPPLGRNQLRRATVAPGGRGQDSEVSQGYSSLSLGSLASKKTKTAF